MADHRPCGWSERRGARSGGATDSDGGLRCIAVRCGCGGFLECRRRGGVHGVRSSRDRGRHDDRGSDRRVSASCSVGGPRFDRSSVAESRGVIPGELAPSVTAGPTTLDRRRSRPPAGTPRSGGHPPDRRSSNETPRRQAATRAPAAGHRGLPRQSDVVTGGCQFGVTIVASHCESTGPDASIVTPVVSVTTGRRSVAPQGMSASA